MRLNNTRRTLCAGALALAVFAAAPAIAWADDADTGTATDAPAIEATLGSQDDLEILASTSGMDVESGSDEVASSAVASEATDESAEPVTDAVDAGASEEVSTYDSTDEQEDAEQTDAEQEDANDDAAASEDAITEVETEGTQTEVDTKSDEPEPIDENTSAVDTEAVPNDTMTVFAADEKTAAPSEPAVLKVQAEAESGKKDTGRTIADGVYVFNTALKNKVLVSTAKNSTKAGTNVQLNADAGTYQQRWMVRYVADGYYTVVLRATSMALTVLGNRAAAGTNVQLAANNKTDGQLWKFVRMSGGYYQLVSKLRSNLVLDVAGAKSANGTNIRIANDNDGKGQKFKLFRANAATKSNVNLANATYTIRYSANKNYMVDIEGGSRDSGANVYLRKSNGTQQQKYRFTSDGQGYYTITDIGTGKVLSTENASVLSGNNIEQATYTGAAIQKWAVQKNGGSYRIVNKATGLSFALKGGTVANGSNIHAMVNSNSNAQKFTIKRTRTIADGIFTINSFKNFNRVFNIKGGSTANYTPVQLQTSDNMSTSQRFQVSYVGLVDGEEIYRIRTAASGGWLTYTNDKGLMQYGNHATKVQDSNSWKVISNGSYFSLSNLASDRVFNLRNGSTDSGTAILASAANKSTSQHFYFVPTNLLPNGSYCIYSGLGKTALTINGSSTDAGANVQANSKTGSASQMFTLKAIGTDKSTYYIANVNSGKVVAVSGSATNAGANVVQTTKTGAKSQRWIAQIADGGYVSFVNANSGKVLAVAGNSSKSGANVQQNNALAVNGQKWKLVSRGWTHANGSYDYYDANGVKSTWNRAAYTAWTKIKNMASKTRYLGVVDQNLLYTTFFIKQGGAWKPCNNWICSVSGQGRTPKGTYEIKSKAKYVLTHFGSGSWYWSHWGPDSQAFHSVLTEPDSQRVTWSGLGKRNTSGCVRCPMEKAKWVYDNVPRGTKVYSY